MFDEVQPAERILHHIEVQSMQIERVLSDNRVDAELAGGTLDMGSISYVLRQGLAAGLDRLRTMKSDLATALGVTNVEVGHESGRWWISVKRADDYPVNLLDLMEAVPDAPGCSAVLGLDSEDRPVILNLEQAREGNILVAGADGAGKSGFLRTFALSLAMYNRQSNVQLAVIDVNLESAERRQLSAPLYPIGYLPHMLFPVVGTLEAAAEDLAFLAREVLYREEQSVAKPLLVVAIDNADALVKAGGAPICGPLTELLEKGPDVGVRLVLAANDLSSEPLRSLLKSTLSIRFVGKVADPEAARAATGLPGSQAEYLKGAGDFLAIVDEIPAPFQAAYLGDNELHLVLEHLHRQLPDYIILAEPVSSRQTFPQEKEAETAQAFAYDSDNRRARFVDMSVVVGDQETVAGEPFAQVDGDIGLSKDDSGNGLAQVVTNLPSRKRMAPESSGSSGGAHAVENGVEHDDDSVSYLDDGARGLPSRNKSPVSNGVRIASWTGRNRGARYARKDVEENDQLEAPRDGVVADADSGGVEELVDEFWDFDAFWDDDGWGTGE